MSDLHFVKKALMVAAGATLSSFIVQPHTRAVTLTMTETFDAIAPNTVVSGPGQFADFVLSAGSDTIFVSSSNPGPDLSGNTIRKNPFVGSPYRADFLVTGVERVSVTLGDFNADAENLFLQAFDTDNNLVDRVTSFLSASTFGGPTLEVTSTLNNIAYVVFGNTGTFPNSVFADNFSYTYNPDSEPVPEPFTILGSLSALGIGAAQTFQSNQLRLWLHSLAYILISAFRQQGFKKTSLATTTVGIIPMNLFKLGARITINRFKF